MPLIIIVVAFLILTWSQCSQRQSLAGISDKIEGLISNACKGPAPDHIRWADSTLRDAVMSSAEALCDSSPDSLAIVAVSDSDDERPIVEVRIARDNQNVMTLEVEELSDGHLLVRGWSSE